MRNKHYILFIIMLATIALLAIPLIPHHHHPDGQICLLTGENNNYCSKHNHSAESEDDSCCNSMCQAKFSSYVASAEEGSFSPHPIIIALFAENFTIDWLICTSEYKLKPKHHDKEALFNSDFTHSKLLRGPPQC